MSPFAPSDLFIRLGKDDLLSPPLLPLLSMKWTHLSFLTYVPIHIHTDATWPSTYAPIVRYADSVTHIWWLARHKQVMSYYYCSSGINYLRTATAAPARHDRTEEGGDDEDGRGTTSNGAGFVTHCCAIQRQRRPQTKDNDRTSGMDEMDERSIAAAATEPPVDRKQTTKRIRESTAKCHERTTRGPKLTRDVSQTPHFNVWYYTGSAIMDDKLVTSNK